MLGGLLGFNQHNRDKWVRQHLKAFPAGGSILDVGAGDCPYRDDCAHLQYRTHDFKQLSDEQLVGRKGYGKIDFVSDIVSIPVEDASFDFILCTEVIEHVPYPIEAVKEMLRILKPGGKMILTAPLGSHVHQAPYHYYGGYTPFFYNKILADYGVSHYEISPNKGYFSFYAQESIRMAKSLLSPKHLPLNIIMLPFIIPAAVLSIAFRNILDGKNPDPHYTVGFHLIITK